MKMSFCVAAICLIGFGLLSAQDCFAKAAGPIVTDSLEYQIPGVVPWTAVTPGMQITMGRTQTLNFRGTLRVNTPPGFPAINNGLITWGNQTANGVIGWGGQGTQAAWFYNTPAGGGVYSQTLVTGYAPAGPGLFYGTLQADDGAGTQLFTKNFSIMVR